MYMVLTYLYGDIWDLLISFMNKFLAGFSSDPIMHMHNFPVEPSSGFTICIYVAWWLSCVYMQVCSSLGICKHWFTSFLHVCDLFWLISLLVHVLISFTYIYTHICLLLNHIIVMHPTSFEFIPLLISHTSTGLYGYPAAGFEGPMLIQFMLCSIDLPDTNPCSCRFVMLALPHDFTCTFAGP